MVILDVAVVVVALPEIKNDLGFSQEGVQWVVTAYSILFGGTLLLGGRLADVLGRRRVFAAGVAVFAIGSLLSGIAWSEAALVGARALQGFGGALLSPAALSIIITTFREGRERNRALGIWGGAAAAGGSAGVLLGGLLTSYAGWPWIFYINLPVAALILAATPFLLAESRGFLGHRHFDVAGAATVTTGLMTLVYGLTYAGEHAWADAQTIALLAASAVLLTAFFLIEWRSKAPLLPLRLLRSRMLSAANATMIGVGALAFGNFFLVTLYLQDVLGYSPIETGVAFIGITLSIGVFSNIGPVLANRYGVRRVLSTGMALSALGVLLYAQMPAGGHYFWDVFPALMVTGIGLGLSFVPVTIAALQGVAPVDAGVASGLINTTRQVGGAIGIAAVTTIAATVTANDTGVAPAVALNHGFHAAFYVLAAIALLGSLTAAAFLGRPRTEAESDKLDDVVVLEEAA